MIRLCALLWILKIQEDCYERRKAQNRHEGLQQPLKSEELLEGVATGVNTPNQVKWKKTLFFAFERKTVN